MALGSQQDMSLCRAGGEGKSCWEQLSRADFGVELDQHGLKCLSGEGMLREMGGSENGEPEDGQRGPTASLLNLQCWVWAGKAASESHPQRAVPA